MEVVDVRVSATIPAGLREDLQRNYLTIRHVKGEQIYRVTARTERFDSVEIVGDPVLVVNKRYEQRIRLDEVAEIIVRDGTESGEPICRWLRDPSTRWLLRCTE